MITFDKIRNQAPPTISDYINRLVDTPQGACWHPESNVLIHTIIVFNRSLKYNDINITLAAFFHDLGKVDTTKSNNKGGYSAHEHELVSADLVKYSRSWIKELGGDIDIIYWIVKNHMRVKYIDEMTTNKKKSLIYHQWYPKLERFASCDNMRTLTIKEIIDAKGNIFLFLWNKLKNCK